MKFKLVGVNSELFVEGVLCKEGDIVELSENQAMELKGIIAPADEAAEVLLGSSAVPTDLKKYKVHEQEGYLLEAKEKLQAQLKKVDAALAELKKTPEKK